MTRPRNVVVKAVNEAGQAEDEYFTVLQSLSEEVAGLLSEVTLGDVHQPAGDSGYDIGGLFLHLVEQDLHVAALMTSKTNPTLKEQVTRPVAARCHDDHGDCGFAGDYRRTSQLVAQAFSAAAGGSRTFNIGLPPKSVSLPVLFDIYVAHTVTHAQELARALGLPCGPIEGWNSSLGVAQASRDHGCTLVDPVPASMRRSDKMRPRQGPVTMEETDE